MDETNIKILICFTVYTASGFAACGTLFNSVFGLNYQASKMCIRDRLTDKGRKAGDYLLFRHDILNRFLCMINESEDELEQVEKIEHFINEKTIYNIENFLKIHEKEKRQNKGPAV